jgi:hypothetical protein
VIGLFFGLGHRHRLSWGVDNSTSTLWFSVPANCFHKCYTNGVPLVSMSGIGLGTGVDAALLPLFVSISGMGLGTGDAALGTGVDAALLPLFVLVQRPSIEGKRPNIGAKETY